MEGRLDSIEKSIPRAQMRHGRPFPFAYRSAELVGLELEPGTTLPEAYRQ